eukprot:549825-Rhodomonas_salina.1
MAPKSHTRHLARIFHLTSSLVAASFFSLLIASSFAPRSLSTIAFSSAGMLYMSVPHIARVAAARFLNCNRKFAIQYKSRWRLCPGTFGWGGSVPYLLANMIEWIVSALLLCLPRLFSPVDSQGIELLRSVRCVRGGEEKADLESRGKDVRGGEQRGRGDEEMRRWENQAAIVQPVPHVRSFCFCFHDCNCSSEESHIMALRTNIPICTSLSNLSFV